MKVVSIYGLNSNRENEEWGKIRWDGSAFQFQPDRGALRLIVSQPILLPIEGRMVIVDPKKEPERFLENLHQSLRSPYCQASRAKNVE